MDKKYVKSAIEGLKSNSSSCVLENLHKIRNKIITTESGINLFRECNGFSNLVLHLRKPNERILDMTLSILGNCCLEESSRLTIGRLNIYGQLVFILKIVSRDSMVGRVCRVIGNLAQSIVNTEGLYNNGAIPALVATIESRNKNTSNATLTMAVRAIRQLWMLKEKRNEMLSLNVVRCVSSLLTKECENAGIIKSAEKDQEYEGLSRSCEDLINGILKCMDCFVRHASLQCLEQIHGDGNGYLCLVALIKTHETLALKVVMNLCHLERCQLILGSAGFVECLVSLLNKISEVSWWPEGSVDVLALLNYTSENRSRLLHCGGLPLLVSAAKVSTNALYALQQHTFNDDGLNVLIDGGLITCLINEVVKYLITMESKHSFMESIKVNDRISENFNNTKVSLKSQQEKSTHENNICDENENLSARRKCENSLKTNGSYNVVIKRDNAVIDFTDEVHSDSSDGTENEDNGGRPMSLKRPGSDSPKKAKRLRLHNDSWTTGVHWNVKGVAETFSSVHVSPGASADMSRSNPLSPCSDGNQSGFSPEYPRFSSKRPRGIWSPDSGISSGEGSCSFTYQTDYQWSPNSSGPSSPFSFEEDSCDSVMSGRYSPVCSEDNEELENVKNELTSVDQSVDLELDSEQVAQDLSDLIMDDDCNEDMLDVKVGTISIKNQTSPIEIVLFLLLRVTFHIQNNETLNNCIRKRAQELLAGRECLNALLDYMERCESPSCWPARIIAQVLSDPLCLLSILKHRLALRLYKMSVTSQHPPSQCGQCKEVMMLSIKLLKRLSKVAESQYGGGVIAYQLFRGTEQMKHTLSLTLPYIVRTDQVLKKYFIECGALNLLVAIMADSKEDTHDSIIAITKLAKNAQIKDPKLLETRFKDQVNMCYDPILDNLAAEEIVTFELDDTSTVVANKRFLCQNSEVFSAMLLGNFKESTDKCVRLKNVTKAALESMLTLLHCGLNNSNDEIRVFPMAENLDTNLEVLLLADMFLFDKLKDSLNSAILQFRLNPNTANKIYIWSLNEGMGHFCFESLAFMLTGKMCDSDRIKIFKKILALKYKDQLLDDIKTMILSQLMK